MPRPASSEPAATPARHGEVGQRPDRGGADHAAVLRRTRARRAPAAHGRIPRYKRAGAPGWSSTWRRRQCNRRAPAGGRTLEPQGVVDENGASNRGTSRSDPRPQGSPSTARESDDQIGLSRRLALERRARGDPCERQCLVVTKGRTRSGHEATPCAHEAEFGAREHGIGLIVATSNLIPRCAGIAVTSGRNSRTR